MEGGKMSELMTIDDQKTLWDFSCKISKSRMIPQNFQGKPEDVFVTCLYGNELGMTPVVALNSICVIQGQVTLKVQTMNAIVRARCPDAIIEIEQDTIKKVVTVTAKRHKDDAPYSVTWDMERAKALGLANKHNYQKQPVTMLKARALSDALRTVFPDVLSGFYSVEEMADSDEKPPMRHVGITQEDMDADFPIPEEEKTVGFLYRFQNGKFKGDQVKDCDPEDLASYQELLRNRINKTGGKGWEREIHGVITDILENWTTYEDAYEASLGAE
jgi:hypothetical protein